MRRQLALNPTSTSTTSIVTKGKLSRSRELPPRRRSLVSGPEQRVRDIVVDQIGQSTFEERVWYQICAALDNVGDTAIILESPSWRKARGSFAAGYMRLYGLLQAVHSQQDSIEFLSRTVARQWSRPHKDSAWQTLRRVRNELTAHAAKGAGTVARTTLNSATVTIMRWPSSEPSYQIERVALDTLLDLYMAEASESMCALAKVLCAQRVNAPPEA